MIPDNQYKMIDFIIKVSFYSLNQKEIQNSGGKHFLSILLIICNQSTNCQLTQTIIYNLIKYSILIE